MDIQKTEEQERLETERLRAAMSRDNLRGLFGHLSNAAQGWFLKERNIPCPGAPAKGRTMRQERTRALLGWYDNLVRAGGDDAVRI